MAIERTFSIIKPDAVAKNNIGAIYNRFETAGLKIIASKMVHLTKANNKSLKVLNLGQFNTLRTLKLSWLILRKKHEILQAMPPLVPIKHIKKDKNSRRYNLRLIIGKGELDNTICQQLNRPANFCFIEHIVLDKP